MPTEFENLSVYLTEKFNSVIDSLNTKVSTGDLVSVSILATNVVRVDSVNGDDVSAEIGNAYTSFKSIMAAMTAVKAKGAGTYKVVLSGSFDECVFFDGGGYNIIVDYTAVSTHTYTGNWSTSNQSLWYSQANNTSFYFFGTNGNKLLQNGVSSNLLCFNITGPSVIDGLYVCSNIGGLFKGSLHIKNCHCESTVIVNMFAYNPSGIIYCENCDIAGISALINEQNKGAIFQKCKFTCTTSVAYSYGDLDMTFIDCEFNVYNQAFYLGGGLYLKGNNTINTTITSSASAISIKGNGNINQVNKLVADRLVIIQDESNNGAPIEAVTSKGNIMVTQGIWSNKSIGNFTPIASELRINNTVVPSGLTFTIDLPTALTSSPISYTATGADTLTTVLNWFKSAILSQTGNDWELYIAGDNANVEITTGGSYKGIKLKQDVGFVGISSYECIFQINASWSSQSVTTGQGVINWLSGQIISSEYVKFLK